MYLLAEVREKLTELGISPKKSLGQNFLVNANSIQRIIDAVRDIPSASIIEIGPGLGALTEGLRGLGHPILIIELDRKLSEWWREKGFDVVEGDALRVDWSHFTIPKPICLVSNLPYQISSSLVIDRSIDPCGVESMVLMFQKEVAQRMTAKKGSKDYGMLSVIAQTFWDISKLFEISSKDFWPPPQVASRVLVFRRKDCHLGQDFLTFVKAAFAQRRKFLIKNLGSVVDLDGLSKVFEEAEIDPKVRAEELSPEQYQDLFDRTRKATP